VTIAATAPITSFRGPYRLLSNFADTPFWFTLNSGYRYYWPTAEHAYQASKAGTPADRGWIAAAPTPGEAKHRGRGVQSLRPDWGQVKRQIMMQVILAKFGQRPPRELLLTTGNAALVEGNTWGDDYWGAVPAAPGWQTDLWVSADGAYWAGRNWLGRILMMTRDLLAAER
jgi:ribA/ribD-fused uncharacterized protein